MYVVVFNMQTELTATYNSSAILVVRNCFQVDPGSSTYYSDARRRKAG